MNHPKVIKKDSSTLLPILFGAIIGAGVMYCMDPIQGSRRRAMLLNRWTSVKNTFAPLIMDKLSSVWSNAQGLFSKVKNSPIARGKTLSTDAGFHREDKTTSSLIGPGY